MHTIEHLILLVASAHWKAWALRICPLACAHLSLVDLSQHS